MLGEPRMQDWQYVVDPYWRVSYTPPTRIRELLGPDASMTICKVYEILDSFFAELLTEPVTYVIKERLLMFIGDRDLRVNREIIDGDMCLIVMFNDDDEVRRIIRL